MALCERPGGISDPVSRDRDNGVIGAGRVIPRSAASPLGCGSFDASVSNAFRMTSGLEVRAAVLDGAGLGGLLFLSDSCLRGILAHVGRGQGAGSSLFLSCGMLVNRFAVEIRRRALPSTPARMPLLFYLLEVQCNAHAVHQHHTLIDQLLIGNLCGDELPQGLKVKYKLECFRRFAGLRNKVVEDGDVQASEFTALGDLIENWFKLQR